MDNFNLVSLTGLIGGFKVAKTAINNLIKKTIPISKVICEPQLGKRRLYPTLSKKNASYSEGIKLSDFLQYSDGQNDLEDIAKYIKVSKRDILRYKNVLLKKNLIIC